MRAFLWLSSIVCHTVFGIYSSSSIQYGLNDWGCVFGLCKCQKFQIHPNLTILCKFGSCLGETLAVFDHYDQADNDYFHNWGKIVSFNRNEQLGSKLGLFIKFAVISKSAFLSFGIIIITDAKFRGQVCWGLLTNIWFFIGFVIWISCLESICIGIFLQIGVVQTCNRNISDCVNKGAKLWDHWPNAWHWAENHDD